MGQLISIMLPFIIIFAIFKMFMSFMPFDMDALQGWKSVAKKAFIRKGYIPIDPSDRLKKYIIKASKINPTKCTTLKLQRTKYNEGGKIGKIVGVLPSRSVTRFVFRSNRFSKRILYCPVDMHTDLHGHEVVIKAVAITNPSGYYYPVPYDGYTEHQVFQMVNDAYSIDLKKMETMDLHSIAQIQTYKSITSREEARKLVEKPEDVKEKELSAAEEKYA